MADEPRGGTAAATRLGHFRLDKLLGHGAFGTVYAGIDVHLRRPVAVKILDPAMMASDKVRRRFFREARILANLDHPAIVRVFYAGTGDKGPFYAMEMLSRGSLRIRLRESGKLAEPDVVQLLEDIMPGLATLHDAGVVHRDLKPGNILFTDTGRAKIADFGLALEGASTRLTTAGSILGTPPYLAPEQWEGASPSVRSDLYALGVIAFECLSGRLPFASKSIPELATKVCGAPVDYTWLTSVPNGDRWRMFLRALLEKRPEDRPDSAWAALNRLSPLRSERIGTIVDEPSVSAPVETFESEAVASAPAPAAVQEPEPSAIADAHVSQASDVSVRPAAPVETTPRRGTRPSRAPRPVRPAPAPTPVPVPAGARPAGWERLALVVAVAVAAGAGVTVGVQTFTRQALRAEVGATQAHVEQLKTQLAQSERERRRLGRRNIELQGKLASLLNELLPQSAPFALNDQMTTQVAGAWCAVRFARPDEKQPHLTFELDVVNRSQVSLPGLIEISTFDEGGLGLGQARVNLLPGRPGSRLAPGGQGSASGSLRITSSEGLPARFRLAFVESGL